MGRDPRKGAAYASGMRGREKPNVSGAHGGTMGQEDSNAGQGNEKQGPGKIIGNPDGVPHTDPVYSSGMRGLETGKQKAAGGSAQYGQGNEGSGGGENKQGPDRQVGNPDGDNTAKKAGPASGVSAGTMHSHASDAYGMKENSLERSATGEEPIGAEEDETHINVRIPKSSLKKKQGAGQAV